jgi:hypothetical protein
MPDMVTPPGSLVSCLPVRVHPAGQLRTRRRNGACPTGTRGVSSANQPVQDAPTTSAPPASAPAKEMVNGGAPIGGMQCLRS